MYIASIWILSDHCSAQGGIRMQHSLINRPAISKCSRCGRTEYTQHLIFKQNVSYFFARKERQFSGDLQNVCECRTHNIDVVGDGIGSIVLIVGWRSPARQGHLLDFAGRQAKSSC
jgi:hypothetical protein